MSNSSINNSSIEKKHFAKSSLILPVVTIINPVIGIGSFVAASSAFHRAYLVVDLAYMSNNNSTIAENVLSKSINKDCKVSYLIQHNILCN